MECGAELATGAAVAGHVVLGRGPLLVSADSVRVFGDDWQELVGAVGVVGEG